MAQLAEESDKEESYSVDLSVSNDDLPAMSTALMDHASSVHSRAELEKMIENMDPYSKLLLNIIYCRINMVSFARWYQLYGKNPKSKKSLNMIKNFATSEFPENHFRPGKYDFTKQLKAPKIFEIRPKDKNAQIHDFSDERPDDLCPDLSGSEQDKQEAQKLIEHWKRKNQQIEQNKNKNNNNGNNAKYIYAGDELDSIYQQQQQQQQSVGYVYQLPNLYYNPINPNQEYLVNGNNVNNNQLLNNGLLTVLLPILLIAACLFGIICMICVGFGGLVCYREGQRARDMREKNVFYYKLPEKEDIDQKKRGLAHYDESV